MEIYVLSLFLEVELLKKTSPVSVTDTALFAQMK